MIAAGQSSTLTVASRNAASATINPGDLSVTLDSSGAGSVTVSPTTTTTYTLTVTADDGATATATATVTVTADPVASLTADPTTITAGQSSTLTVASSNAASATISPGDLSVTLDSSGAGSVTVSPTTTTTYTLTVTAANSDTATDTAAVTVIPAPTAWLSASPEEITPGSRVDLSVNVTNAQSAVIDPGNITVPISNYDSSYARLTVTDANGFSVSATDTVYVVTAALTADPTTIVAGQPSALVVAATSVSSAVINPGNLSVAFGNAGVGLVIVSPTTTTTYTLTAYGRRNSWLTVNDTATVTVNPAPTATLTASPTTIATGQSSTLAVSTDAQSAVINPGNLSVTLDNTGAGSVVVSPTATTIYTLTVTDSGGGQATDTATVGVSDASAPDPGAIATVAGPGNFGGDGAAADAAWLRTPSGVAVDGSGNLYIADTDNHRIRKVDADGDISTVAGDGTAGFGGDGAAATAAQLNSPSGVAVDGSGNLYIADTDNHRIRKVDVDGDISTVAGDGTAGFSGDGGAATAAQLIFPSGVAVDGDGNLYIADTDNHRIRKVDTDGDISTVAGGGSSLGDGGAATAARLIFPSGVAVDGDGNLYIADRNNHRIRKVDADTDFISTVAGSRYRGDSGDGGAATAARLNYPRGVAVDGSGNLYIADTDNHRIRKVDADTDFISTVAGSRYRGDSGDGGAATAARLSSPSGVAVDGSGNLYIADRGNHRIRKVDADTDFISTAAGASSGGGDDGPATAARLTSPSDMAVDGSGNLYIADRNNHRIRKIGTDGNITTVAGTGMSGYSGDGAAATAAQLNFPSGVAVDGSGNLYIADRDNHRIRKVDADTDFISTVAGDGTAGYGGDGAAATAAQLNSPSSVAVDGSGNLYIADVLNSRIRKVDAATGFISTVAGGDRRLGTAGRLLQRN